MLRLSFLSALSFAAVAILSIGALVVAPACTVTTLDDDDDGGEGEGEGDEGEGEGEEGEGECNPGPEDNEAACSDGCSNDDDNFADCEDFDCEDTEACSEQICDDGLDDNGNTFVDCADFACDDDPACAEDCTNGTDDDGDGNVDCEDGFCNGRATGAVDPACVAGVVQIQSIQDETHSLGTVVTVENVFVTVARVGSTGNVNLYIQEPDGEGNGHDYPEFAGLAVFMPSAVAAGFPAAAGIAAGDCVTLTGSVAEFGGDTQISNVTAFAEGTCTTAPAPFTVTLAQIAADTDPATAEDQPAATAEDFEGVLLTIEQVTAVEASGEFGFRVADADGNQIDISDFLQGDGPAVAVDDTFTSITGLFHQFNNVYELQPRTAGDIQ